MKPHVSNLVRLLMSVLTTDAEENAVLCVKTMLELHKNYQALLEESVVVFVKTYGDLIKNLNRTMSVHFGPKPEPPRVSLSLVFRLCTIH